MRYFTPEGELVPTPEESALKEKQQRELAMQQVEMERQQKELALQKVEELREKLRELGINPDEISSLS